jgi:phosphoadenosine phosphosulfate reductase
MESVRGEIEQLQAEVERWGPEKLLPWGLARFYPKVAVASSFGAEDVVLIDIAARSSVNVRVFTLDTDFLFPETYALIEQIEQSYGIRVERARSALTPDEQADQHGKALWGFNPNLCCDLRKVVPLKKQLSELDAWVTGVRRDQAPTRANTKKLEWDAKFGLAKLNPLADWTSAQVWDYIRSHEVPYNPLHDHNYPSIGCTHCTRQVMPGEDPRAGRWSGFNKTECGLHLKE